MRNEIATVSDNLASDAAETKTADAPAEPTGAGVAVAYEGTSGKVTYLGRDGSTSWTTTLGWKDPVNQLTFSPDGRLYTLDYGREINELDVDTGNVLATIYTGGGLPDTLAVTGDGTVLAGMGEKIYVADPDLTDYQARNLDYGIEALDGGQMSSYAYGIGFFDRMLYRPETGDWVGTNLGTWTVEKDNFITAVHLTEDHVYACWRYDGLHRFELDGTDANTDGFPVLASCDDIISSDKHLYTVGNNRLRKIALADGQIVHSLYDASLIGSLALDADGTVYAATGRHVYAYDGDLTELWTAEMPASIRAVASVQDN